MCKTQTTKLSYLKHGCYVKGFHHTLKNDTIFVYVDV